MNDGTRRKQLAPLVDAAHRAEGIVAARGRGAGERAPRRIEPSHTEQELAGGSPLVAELSRRALRRETGRITQRLRPRHVLATRIQPRLKARRP